MGTSLYPMLTYGKLARSFELRPLVGDRTPPRGFAKPLTASLSYSSMPRRIASSVVMLSRGVLGPRKNGQLLRCR